LLALYIMELLLCQVWYRVHFTLGANYGKIGPER
jgi:hypothetical protein